MANPHPRPPPEYRERGQVSTGSRDDCTVAFPSANAPPVLVPITFKRGKEQDVGDIAAVAERLWLVRRARRKFLRLWEIDRSLIEPLVDQVAADLDSATAGTRQGSAEHPDSPLVDEG